MHRQLRHDLRGGFRLRLAALIVSLPLVAAWPAGRPAGAADPVDKPQANAVVAAVKPALVRILVAEAEYDGGRENKSESAGSGVIISPDGYVVTNHHVAGEAKRLVCTLASREEVEADLVGTDPLTDISVIKLRPSPSGPYPYARWGDSSLLEVGDHVMAMGSPMALSQSVTMGIVSNTELVMPDFISGAMTLEGEDVGSMVRWIGHDASISPGNSGGPLINAQGEIVGINEISMGLGGAIPGNLARKIAEELIKNGKVTRAWIGVSTQPLLKGTTETRGILVGGVLPGSPAEKAGIQPGDLLVKLAGQDVSVRFAEQLPQFNQQVASLPIGKPAEAVVLRDGHEVTLSVTPEVRSEVEPQPREAKAWGICVSRISPTKKLELRRASTDGVLVYSVRTGGPCGVAKPALESDDIILAVNKQPVKTVEDFERITEDLTKGQKESVPVLVTVEHESERIVTVVDIGTKEEDEPAREVRKAYLPVATQVVTPPIAEALNVAGKKGFRITRVDPGSSAQKAGLQVGDIITAIDGDPFDVSTPEENDVLPDLIRQYKIGATVQVSVLRAGTAKKLPVLLETAPPSTREMERYKDQDFEFTARDLSWQDRTDQKLPEDARGAIVEDVASGGWAALGRLSSGDIILAVDDKPIAGVKDLKSAMLSVEAARAPRVVLHVLRGIQELYIEMESDWPVTK